MTPTTTMACSPHADPTLRPLACVGAHTDDQIREVAASLGPEISGKVLIDATNPLSKYPALEVRWDGKSGEDKTGHSGRYRHTRSRPSS